MLKYITIPAIVAITALFHLGPGATAKSAHQIHSNSPLTQAEQGEPGGIGHCRAGSVSDALAADPGSQSDGMPFSVDYMTANGHFFSLKRLFACSGYIHRARIS